MKRTTARIESDSRHRQSVGSVMAGITGAGGHTRGSLIGNDPASGCGPSFPAGAVVGCSLGIVPSGCSEPWCANT